MNKTENDLQSAVAGSHPLNNDSLVHEILFSFTEADNFEDDWHNAFTSAEIHKKLVPGFHNLLGLR